jgi:uncharacterized protein
MKPVCRTTFKAKTLMALLSAVALVASADTARAERKFITFATAGVTGVYYPVAGTICRLVNRQAREHGVRCAVESTGGSIDNLNSLRKNDVDLAFVQSDWHYNSYVGEGMFADQGPDKNLRSLFSLHSEALTIIARSDSGIKTLQDLKNKRFNIGNAGSGTRSTMEELIHEMGWGKDTFSVSAEFRASEQAQKLCDNKIDAFAFNTGHPNGSIQEVTSTCAARLIPVTGPAVDSLVKKYPYYAIATIPGGMYANNANNIPTYGVKATVVSSANVDAALVYQVVKAVFENFDNFKTTHPILSNLNKEQMITNGLTAPLHDGAKRYYIEAGLLKE